MTDDLDQLRTLARGALAALEASRRRIDDLNVYPVPDGDTGTNLALTVRAVVEDLERLEPTDRPTLAHELTRAALMGARGNSGVIFSQIVRGAAEVLGAASRSDVPTVASAFRGASDAAYRAVRRPVEGTMLTVIREMAEEAGSTRQTSVADLLAQVLARGEDALARTPELLEVLREARVVDAGGAGLVEIVRGLLAAVRGEPLPELPAETEAGI
ncbi:MAG TPA: DAK2 domain-containing protein, partial [Gaiellaceae bacterium]|nr:DAK2 domain-containing protein [Gaiellaceae bacterium]